MSSFVRKNKLVFSATFTPKSGQSGTASSANVHIVYTNNSGAQTSVTLPMTLGSDGVTWSALWDSSDCKGGTVTWVAYCAGGLVGSAEGSFVVKANTANTI